MAEEEGRKDFYAAAGYIAGLIIAVSGLCGFLFLTGFARNAVALVVISLFVLYPYRKRSAAAGRLLAVIIIFFSLWLVSLIGSALVPFFFALLSAYILDPLITRLSGRGRPRWLVSLLAVLALAGIAAAFVVYVAPLIIAQLYDAANNIYVMVQNFSKDYDSHGIYRFAAKFGISREKLDAFFQQQLLPKYESLFSFTYNTAIKILTGISSVITQVVYAILTPVLIFYLLKDFDKLKGLIKALAGRRDPRMPGYLTRTSGIIRRYLAWQVLAAFIVATLSSTSYSLLGVPYPIVLGMVSGLMNPIPYLGGVISMIIGVLTVIIMAPDYLLPLSGVVIGTMSAIHFINAYLLEPNIAGRQVGLHPVVIIISLFVFGSLYGFVGMLIAIPATAVLMMFFNDWKDNYLGEGKTPGDAE